MTRKLLVWRFGLASIAKGHSILEFFSSCLLLKSLNFLQELEAKKASEKEAAERAARLEAQVGFHAHHDVTRRHGTFIRHLLGKGSGIVYVSCS